MAATGVRFALLCLLLVVGGACYELQWGDAAEDEYGGYPTDPGFEPYYGLFDLLEFTVSNETAEQTGTRFAFTLANVTDPWYGPNGFSAALIQCYIHTSPLGSWRVQQVGGSEPIGNPNVQLSPLYKWTVMLEVSGWNYCLVDSVGERLCGLSGTVVDNTIVVDVPEVVLGPPQESWSFTVLSGAAEFPGAGSEPGAEVHFLEHTADGGLFAFSGGDNSTADPNVVDILQVQGTARSQEAVLNAYCASSGARATVSPIGLQMPPTVEAEAIAVPLSPGGNGCVGQPSSNVTARYVVSEEVSVTANIIVLRLSLLSPGMPELGPDVDTVLLTVDMSYTDYLRITFDDSEAPRCFPTDVLQDHGPILSLAPNPNYRVEFTSDPFSIQVRRPSGEVLFDTAAPPSSSWPNLVFKERYVELTTALAANANLYGLGERVGAFRVQPNHVYSMWNLDQGTPEGKNLYGVHPFYVDLRDGSAHGVFLLNSYGVEVAVTEESATFKAMGGALDFFIFVGPEPETVVRQYQYWIGKPALPPLWAFGAHQCRWGYEDVAAVRKVVDQYRANEIPLDTMWSDIDYMDEKKLFTLDPINYSQSHLSSLVDDLHAANQRYVVIVDPGIRVEEGYEVYDAGLARGVFIRDASGEQPALGKVWPGPVAFVDFMAEAAQDFWSEQIAAFHEQVEFDGLWIDMNEIANFCDGHCVLCVDDPADWDTLFDCPCSEIEFHNEDFPPFWVGGMPPATSTISMASKHADGLLEEQVHSLYGHMEAIATAKALQDLTGERTLVITRSSFAGTGYHAGHWLGDNTATWDDLRWSISGMMSMNLFGIPFTGADICGFNGNTTVELCARWYQVGAWYPFCRNHNVIGALSQEPYALGPTVMQVARTALQNRYRLIPTFYKWFVEAHKSGGTVIRPLFFEFANDTRCYDVEDQFMLGSDIMVAPVLEAAVLERTVYFPSPALWYGLWSGVRVEVPEDGLVTFDGVSIADTFEFLRGGTVLALQEPALTVAELVRQPLYVVVALDPEQTGVGHLYMDDGVSIDPAQAAWGLYAAAKVENSNKGRLTIFGLEADFEDYDPVWSGVSVYGVESPCDLAIVTTDEWEYYFWPDNGLDYDEETKVLTVTGMNVSITGQMVTMEWGKAAEPPTWAFRIIVIVGTTVAVVAVLCLVALAWHLGTKYLPDTGIMRRLRGGEDGHSYSAPGSEDASELQPDDDLFAIDDEEEEGEEMVVLREAESASEADEADSTTGAAAEGASED